MTTKATVILDSINDDGERLITLALRYGRPIHAEFMTHRVFSRNASSSRAIPVKRLIQDVMDDPFIPCHWGKNQPGMQAREEHDAEVVIGFGSDDYVFGTPEQAWLMARDRAVEMAQFFDAAGYHKQVVNRLIEPFAHINVVVTATDWDNFFQLRLHEDAEPNIRLLAEAMKEAISWSQPKALHYGDWHLPFTTDEEKSSRTLEQLQMVSVARCARVSYRTHDGQPTDFDKDYDLGIKLLEAGHLSPFEHQATPLPGRYANFQGWCSLRNGNGL